MGCEEQLALLDNAQNPVNTLAEQLGCPLQIAGTTRFARLEVLPNTRSILQQNWRYTNEERDRLPTKQFTGETPKETQDTQFFSTDERSETDADMTETMMSGDQTPPSPMLSQVHILTAWIRRANNNTCILPQINIVWDPGGMFSPAEVTRDYSLKG